VAETFPILRQFFYFHLAKTKQRLVEGQQTQQSKTKLQTKELPIPFFISPLVL
jgi:hypothetical protein